MNSKRIRLHARLLIHQAPQKPPLWAITSIRRRPLGDVVPVVHLRYIARRLQFGPHLRTRVFSCHKYPFSGYYHNMGPPHDYPDTFRRPPLTFLLSTHADVILRNKRHTLSPFNRRHRRHTHRTWKQPYSLFTALTDGCHAPGSIPATARPQGRSMEAAISCSALLQQKAAIYLNAPTIRSMSNTSSSAAIRRVLATTTLSSARNLRRTTRA